MTYIGNLRYTPYAASGDDTTYIIRAATTFEKMKFEAEISSSPYFAAEPRSWLFADVIDDFVNMRFEGDALTGAREALAAVRGGTHDDDQKALAEAIEGKARLYHKPYIELLDQVARRQTYVPYLATKFFLTGWEDRKDAAGVDIPFKLEDGKVSDISMSTLSEIDIQLIGLTAFRFMKLGDTERKNLVSELASTAVPLTSTSHDTTDTADGTSATNTTTKTRNTKSRKTVSS